MSAVSIDPRNGVSSAVSGHWVSVTLNSEVYTSSHSVGKYRPRSLTQSSKSASLSSFGVVMTGWSGSRISTGASAAVRSEEHTSELQSRGHLVCRLLLEKKKDHTLLLT